MWLLGYSGWLLRCCYVVARLTLCKKKEHRVMKGNLINLINKPEI